MSEPKEVLIFTYYWPPAGGPGVQRYLKFCKFLPLFGWRPVVVTVQDGGYPYLDPSLEKDISPDAVIFKTNAWEPFEWYNLLTGGKGKSVPVAMSGIRDSKSPVKRMASWIRANWFIPDARIGWGPFAYKQGLKLLRERPIKAIITTGPPHSCHLTGLKLHTKTAIPWVADFRDPWHNIYYNRFLPRTQSAKEKDKALEDSVVSAASLLTVATPGLREEFKDRARQIALLFNGFDEEDMPQIHKRPSPTFDLTYIGNLKPNQNPKGLWAAIAHLCEQEQDFRQLFRLVFVGNTDPTVMETIRSFGLEDLLISRPFVPHKEATQLMAEATLLNFIIPQSANNQLILTGKIFEYIASRSPILSIGPKDGDAAAILMEAGRDAIHDYDEDSSIAQTILYYFRQWKENNQTGFAHQTDSFFRFSRKEQARLLSRHLNRLSDEQTNN